MWVSLVFMAVCITAYQAPEGLANDDITAMFRAHKAIEKPHHKTDCFLRVSSTIRARCHQDHMPEDERIHAAISMTLCELATANYQSPPLECASFSLDAQTAGMAATHRLQRDCVEALSRSAQFWSSYSGYLREIRAHISTLHSSGNFSVSLSSPALFRVWTLE
ncbi:hypothetical protein F5887DRAFT_361900 [Amanita rubescens]|nr:hypothetical protein F5887DRAFT_361900 [Amanita rubescens]